MVSFKGVQQMGSRMKLLACCCAVVVVGLVLAGCTTSEGTPDRTATGALVGAGVGAGSGAIIGSTSGRAGKGALIGGAIGAIAGGVAGHLMDMDQTQQDRLQQDSPQTYERVAQGQPLAIADIKALSRADVSDEIIISQIRNTNSVYHLSTSEIIELRDAGVSDRVIDHMINTPSTEGDASVSQ